MEITSLKQLDIVNGVYTYADYLLWKFKERVELLRGKIFEMSAPSPIHQSVSYRLIGEFYRYFDEKPCEVFPAPFDVRFPKENNHDDKKIYTVVQPDLCVVCDLSKIDGKGCLGAPDLVIEIISPGNSEKEKDFKFNLYKENGVSEYWVIDPNEKDIDVYVLVNGEYIGLPPVVQGKDVVSRKFPELRINTKKLFSKKF